MSEAYDFVVVGSGGGAMVAALYMRSQGKSVVVLEKTDLLGGTTATSGGVMWIPNNRFMKEAGIADSDERAIAYLDATVGDDPQLLGATRERRRAYVRESQNMLEFLISQGIKLRRITSWPDYQELEGHSVPGRCVAAELFDINELGEWKSKLRPNFLPLPGNIDEFMQLPYIKKSGAARKAMAKILGRLLISKLRGKHLVGGGASLQGRVLQAALKAGAEFRVNTPVKQLIVENGRVVGVLASENGVDKRIDARLGVLINAGGFARNQQMLDKYNPGVSAEWTSVIPADTGEMIEEAARIGAALAQMHERIGSPVALPPNNPPIKPQMQGDCAKPHAIVVDQSGARYMNEAASYADISAGMLQRNKTMPAVPSWLIVDSQFIRKYMFVGTMPGLKTKPKEWFEQGFIKQGGTIEELAQACGIDPDKLRATIERYNGFVRNGRDEDFRRGERAYDQWAGDPFHEPKKTLGTLEEGPFYAVQIFPGDVSTLGGIVTDVYARALRPDGSVIPGLYATGTSSATVMANRNPGAGTSVGPSYTWGYVAAKHAASAENAITSPTSAETSSINPIGARSAAS